MQIILTCWFLMLLILLDCEIFLISLSNILSCSCSTYEYSMSYHNMLFSLVLCALQLSVQMCLFSFSWMCHFLVFLHSDQWLLQNLNVLCITHQISELVSEVACHYWLIHWLLLVSVEVHCWYLEIVYSELDLFISLYSVVFVVIHFQSSQSVDLLFSWI